MSLPDPWVDRIFAKLSLVYGHQFLSRWDGMPIDAVKADWARELSAYQQSPTAIAYALENLPTKPPTVLEFRDLCRRGPSTAAYEQHQPRVGYSGQHADPSLVRETIAAIKTRQVPGPIDAKQWARDLQEHDRTQPRTVTPTVRAMYRRALGLQA